jgi:hypothetical protein
LSLHQDKTGLLRLLLLANVEVTHAEAEMIRSAAYSKDDLPLRVLVLARRLLTQAGFHDRARYFDLECLAWVRNRVYFVRKAVQGRVSLLPPEDGNVALVPVVVEPSPSRSRPG